VIHLDYDASSLEGKIGSLSGSGGKAGVRRPGEVKKVMQKARTTRKANKIIRAGPMLPDWTAWRKLCRWRT